MDSDPFIPKRELSRHVPYHPDTFIRMAKEGRAPAPVRLSPRKVGWFLSSLSAFKERAKAA
jgi:predicted DNA-binding transcriptional regulator AlpA